MANKIQKPITRKFQRHKVYSSNRDNIWNADRADMHLISKYNKGVRFLRCLIDDDRKYTRFVSLKDKKGITITNTCQKILDESGIIPNKTWVDHGSQFNNRSLKSWLHHNDIEMYSTHNEGKSVLAERSIYKHLTAVSKKLYIDDKIDEIVDKYNKTDRTIKVKLANVRSGTYTDYGVEHNDKDPKFKVDYDVRISKYKNIFAKGYCPNWYEGVFVIKKVKSTVPWTCVINSKEVVGTLNEKGLQKASLKDFRIEKLIKRKGDRL